MSESILYAGKPLPESWEEIDTKTQDLLIEWYNTRKEDLNCHDLRLLAALYHDGKIEFGKCIECGMTCFRASPESWDEFQGTGVGMVEGIYGTEDTYCGDCAGEIMGKARDIGL